MDYGGVMKFHQDSIDKTYLNSGYTDKRTKRQTLLVDVKIGNTKTTFDSPLQEPLIIDSLSDIYLDSFTTYKTKSNTTKFVSVKFPVAAPLIFPDEPSTFLYLLKIDQFNVKTNTNDPPLKDKIIIANESTDNTKTFNHMSRKMNYVCSINPTELDKITGSIMNHESLTIGAHTDARFIAEFVIVSRSDDS